MWPPRGSGELPGIEGTWSGERYVAGSLTKRVRQPMNRTRRWCRVFGEVSRVRCIDGHPAHRVEEHDIVADAEA